jgi:hypothetical protein
VEAEAAAEAARAQQVAVAKLAEALGQCHTVAPAVGSGNDPVSGSAAVVPAAPTRGGGGDTVTVNTAGGSAAVAPTAPAPDDGSGGLPVGGTAADALELDRCAALSGAPSYGEGLRYELHMMWVELRLLQHLDTALTGELVILRQLRQRRSRRPSGSPITALATGGAARAALGPCRPILGAGSAPRGTQQPLALGDPPISPTGIPTETTRRLSRKTMH